MQNTELDEVGGRYERGHLVLLVLVLLLLLDDGLIQVLYRRLWVPQIRAMSCMNKQRR